MRAILLSAAIAGLLSGSVSADEPAQIVRASFNDDGSANLPTGYRQWWHVGTRLKPDGISIFDGLPLKAPEFFNSYVEPSAFQAFQKTGVWPDGTQIIKEVSAIQIGTDCDGATRICKRASGTGIYEAQYMGIGLMVKDAKRFPNSAGHWGYFNFGHRPPPYDPVAAPKSHDQCESCHVSLASDTDYVISRAHIGLTAVK